MLNFTDVTVRRGPRVLFSNATFSLFRGEKAGITGESGSGKSTLLGVPSRSAAPASPLNGYEACRRIRALRPEDSLIIVALTGWRQEEDRRRSRDAGFDGHLVKPIDPAALAGFLAGAVGTPH